MDAGYDVWMPNGRGTRYSLGHETLDARTDPEYWDFSFDMQGKYDNPANINKVLEVTKYEKVAFVGFSMGTMQTFYGMAKDQAGFYRDKVSVFVALAPCTKLTHSTFNFMHMGAALYDRFMEDFEHSHVKALYGPNWEEDLEALCCTENIVVCMALQGICIGDG